MRSSLKQMSKNTTASSKSAWNYKFAKFTKLKWECAKLLITTFIQIQRNNEETIPTALAENIMEACVEGLDVATHDFIAPIFGCLALVIPHTLPSALYSSPATAEPSTQWLSKFEEVLEQGWMAQQQCKKFEGIDAFIGMVFQPALLQISALSANDASPLKRYFNRVMKAGEYYYGAVGRLTERCCAVWRDSSTDIQVCFNFMPEIIELCLYGPQRKVLDVESNQLYSGGGAGLEHQDSFVRGCILAFLWSGLHLRLHKEKEKSGSARKKCVRMFVQKLLEQLLDLNFTAAYDSAYRLHSVGHRNRIRMWQTISLLVGRYLEGEMESSLVPILNSRIWRILEITNLRSVRNFVELVLVHMLLLRPELISSQKPQQEILESHKQQETAPEQGCLLSLLARINDRPEVVTAAIAVAGMLLRFLPADAPIYHPLFKALMVFITCHHVTIRTLAHVAFLKVVTARNDYFLHTLEAGEAQLVAACFRYLMGNDESQKAFEKHQHWLVPPSPPVEQMQPERVLYRLPLEQHLPTEECVHPKIFEYLCADGRTSDQAIPYDAIYQELTLEEQKENDRRTQETEQKLEGQREGGGKINNNYRSNEKQAFQKKIMPWAKEQTSDEVGGGERSGMSRRKGEEDKNETELSRILQFDHEMTRSEFLKASQRQEIIVVATLIDKVPNMAGLARTCEIFNASTLVLHSMAVTHERVFQSISVTAEKWLPIEAVPEKDLASYLRMKKEEDGFSLIGVEQTSNSISLAEFSFPKKTLLLLGAINLRISFYSFLFSSFRN
ncbi:SpoU rRNA Methylase family [Balamuthia mandrillaris]